MEGDILLLTQKCWEQTYTRQWWCLKCSLVYIFVISLFKYILLNMDLTFFQNENGEKYFLMRSYFV